MTDANLTDQLLSSLLEENRRERRWRYVRLIVKSIIVLLIILVLFVDFDNKDDSFTAKGPYVSMVRLTGPVMTGQAFSARRVLPELQKAFSDPRAKGVLLVINSPGGLPVQATIIHDKILQLKKKYHKKVVVIGQDVVASAAYLVATAGDKIYVHKGTYTGSIGVVYASFGYTKLLSKLGVQRRLYTAGVNKYKGDPFSPLMPKDIKKIQVMLNQTHQLFINDVLQGRKGKLRGNKSELFSGDIWLGAQAVKLGLADGTANSWEVLQKEFNVKYVRDYTSKPSIFNGILKMAVAKAQLEMQVPQGHILEMQH